MKIQTKMVLLFSLSISLVFSIATLIISWQIVDAHRNVSENLNTQLIESKAAEASYWLTQRINELRIISRASEARTMDTEKLHGFINRLNDELSPDYGNRYGTFAVGGLDGIGYVTEEQSIDIHDREYFQRAMFGNAKYAISSPVLSKTDQSPIILICYPVLNGLGQKVGFVNGAISLQRLTEIAENIRFYNGISMIVDSDGNVYTNTADKFTDEELTSLLDHVPSVPSATTQVADLPSDDKVVFYAAIPNTDNWYLCTLVNRVELFKETTFLLKSVIAVWGFLLLLCFGVSFVLSRIITKPIGNLSAAMSEVQTGNFNIHIPVIGKDETAVLAASFNRMVTEIKQLMEQIIIEQQDKYRAQLRVLQAQINPHFLYNTLDTLQWKASEYDADELVELINALSVFFRISLSKGKEFICLQDEIAHVKNYLVIQQYRYSDILNYRITADPSLDRYMVCKLILQPIVENAIYHGIKPKLAFGTIRIRAVEQECDILLTVEDDGVGMSQSQLEKIDRQLHGELDGESYGLHNVNQRIQLIYGAIYGIHIDSEVGKGTKVTIRIPKKEMAGTYDETRNM